MKKQPISSKMLVTLAMLTAIEIVLSRFCSISAWNIKIGFSFIPITVAAILYGPLGGGIVGALGDFVGAILFPIGAYFPGFTLTALLSGVTLGVFLHKKQTLPRIIGAVAVKQLLLSQCLSTLWISILYGSPYGPLFITRIWQTLILMPVEILVITAMSRSFVIFRKRALA